MLTQQPALRRGTPVRPGPTGKLAPVSIGIALIVLMLTAFGALVRALVFSTIPWYFALVVLLALGICGVILLLARYRVGLSLAAFGAGCAVVAHQAVIDVLILFLHCPVTTSFTIGTAYSYATFLAGMLLGLPAVERTLRTRSALHP